MSKFLNRLVVEEVDEIAGLWQLSQPLTYFSDSIGLIEVPTGFVTDFASVPRLPFVYLAAGGKGAKAAVLHDWLYSKQYDREVADHILFEALVACGYSSFLADCFYAAVRFGGASHYDAPNNPQPAHVQTELEAP
jgi:hypothetical protein